MISASCRPVPASLQARQRCSSDPHPTTALGVAIASHHDLIVGSRADDKVRQLEALVFQAQADKRIRFTKDFSKDGSGVLLGHPRSNLSGGSSR